MGGDARESPMQQSQYFGGEPDPSWELVGMGDNGTHYIRYYLDREGKRWHTSQKKKGRGPQGRPMLWEDRHGRTFAEYTYPIREAQGKRK